MYSSYYYSCFPFYLNVAPGSFSPPVFRTLFAEQGSTDSPSVIVDGTASGPISSPLINFANPGSIAFAVKFQIDLFIFVHHVDVIVEMVDFGNVFSNKYTHMFCSARVPIRTTAGE